jgi:serine/threonine protein kinase/signal recognition particle receptor subunit beta
MAQINYGNRTLTCKLVFSGPGLSGKTTNLEQIYSQAAPAQRGELTSIATHGDRTIFYDYMPLDLGKVGGLTTRLQLYTVPGQPYYAATRKLILVGVDGIVFVADSQAERLRENARALEELEQQLREMNRDLRDVPLIFQWNKRDLPNAVQAAELERLLNRYRAPCYEAVAAKGKGVLETIKHLSRLVLEHCQEEYGLSGSKRFSGSKRMPGAKGLDGSKRLEGSRRLEGAPRAKDRAGRDPAGGKPPQPSPARPSGRPITKRSQRPPPKRVSKKLAAEAPAAYARAPSGPPPQPDPVKIPLAEDSSLELEPVSPPRDGRDARAEATTVRSPSHPGDPTIGQTVGGCVIMSRLGEGGMGTVYLARHKALGKTFVVKTLKQDQVGVETNVKRFFQEARSAARLEHENVVKVQDVGTNKQGLHYMVMQYVDGQNLEDLIKAHGRFDPREAARVVLEVARALIAIHSAGVIHRDIKAQNIVVNPGGEVKLIDFGLAKDLNAQLRLTQTGGLVGTPAYMAPEMMRSKQIDGRVDIFALGLTFYYMLTAQLPFEGTAIHDLFLGKARLKAPEVFAPDLPSDYRHVLERMLAKQLEVRFRDAESLVSGVERLLAGDRIGPPPGDFWLWEDAPPKPVSAKAETILIEPEVTASLRPRPKSKPKPKTKSKSKDRAKQKLKLEPPPARSKQKSKPKPKVADQRKLGDPRGADPPSRDPEASGDTSLGTKDLIDDKLQEELERARREPGNELGSYVLLANLKNKGIGDLYRGWDSQKRRQVAIRLVEGIKRIDSGTGRRLDALRRLKHPHVVSLLDFGVAAGNFYLVQELIDGAPLGTKRRDPEEALQAILDVTDALAYAHEKQILHGGVQPTSVVVDTDGRGYLMDFGLAPSLERIQGSQRLKLVSARYRPPEALDKTVDARGEVYAVGVLLYTALTGKPPSLKGDFPAPRELEPAVPEGLERVCLKCLEQLPDRRYESVAALHDDLERCQAGKRPKLGGSEAGWQRWKPLQRLLTQAEALAAKAKPKRVPSASGSPRAGLDFLSTPISGRPLWQYAMVILTLLLMLLAIAVILTP